MRPSSAGARFGWQKTPRLYLRPYAPADWPAFGALLMEARVQQYVEGPKNMLAARQLFARLLDETGPPRALGAWHLATGAYIGHAWVTADARQPELGYIVAAYWRGQGLATELAQAMLGHARTNLGLQQLWATVDEDNLDSRRVAEKLGFAATQRIDDGAGTPYFIYRLPAPPSLA